MTLLGRKRKPMQERKFLTVSEAAKRLDVSADSIRRLERGGDLPAALRVGKGQRLFSPEAVEELAKRREQKAS
jgi:excisionase family DNA binding protein